MKSITFKTAKLARDKGFKQSPTKLSEPYYNHKGELNGDVAEYLMAYFKDKDTGSNTKKEFESIQAPTQSTLQAWLIEKGYFASVEYTIEDEWVSTLTFLESNQKDYWDEHTDSYEDSLEYALVEALKYIKTKK